MCVSWFVIWLLIGGLGGIAVCLVWWLNDCGDCFDFVGFMLVC